MRTRLTAAVGVVAVAAGLLSISQDPARAGSVSLQDRERITFPNAGPTLADPDPGRIAVFGLSSVVTDVDVRLEGVSHTFPDDLDIELVGPDGTAVPLMSDNCGGDDLVDADLTFDDEAVAVLDDAEGCFFEANRPSNAGDDDDWVVNPTASALAAFDGSNPNGKWRLIVSDDAAGDTGEISGGWSLSITTAADGTMAVPGGGTTGDGTADRYPLELPITGRTGTITDVDLTLPGLYHSFPADLDVLLVGPNGASVLLMSNACDSLDMVDVDLTFDDDVASSLSFDPVCGSGRTRPTSFSPDSETLPQPAPARPYAGKLSVFDGADPNGIWRVFVNDVGTNDGGFLVGRPELTISTTDVIPPETRFTRRPHTGTHRTARVGFASTEPGSRFECRVDKGAFKPCGSSLQLKHLWVGRHRVQVRAVDAAGNVDPTPAVARWKVRPA